jgi:cytidylate kinase
MLTCSGAEVKLWLTNSKSQRKHRELVNTIKYLYQALLTLHSSIKTKKQLNAERTVSKAKKGKMIKHSKNLLTYIPETYPLPNGSP